MSDVSEIRKLMMLISDLRSKDTERYEAHVAFMNETVTFIKKISDSMNENWKKINDSLLKMNQTIETSLDTLLTGINPESIKETSSSLKEIMLTMERSMQSMNLENVMRELRMLTGQGPLPSMEGKGPEEIGTSFGASYGGSSGGSEEPEIFGYVPGKKKKKKKEESSGLLKPSDLFK